MATCSRRSRSSTAMSSREDTEKMRCALASVEEYVGELSDQERRLIANAFRVTWRRRLLAKLGRACTQSR